MNTRKDIARRMREVLRDARNERREVTLQAQSVGDAACLEASGAIRLTLHDFLPTLDNSLQLPPGLEIETGVTGQEVWPVSISDVIVEEEGETSELTDQELAFANQQSAAPVRSGITIEVSNMAIDSAGFDLLRYVQQKFALAQRRYIVSHLFSMAQFDGNNGPFSTINEAQWITPSGDYYQDIMDAMTDLEAEGFDTRDACIVMDFNMELELKCTPIVNGEGRMVIENGLCCGYPYVANKYFNTEIDDGVLVNSGDISIGIAFFKWFKIAQHDKARLTIDGVSQGVATRNVTSITLSSVWSFTDLSTHINGGNSQQAFKMIHEKLSYLADTNDVVFETSDGDLLVVVDNS